ncbi:helix-turn-helix transcriptional regulator [Rhizobium tumorigenes]|uniref:LuxR family transcriptional regulator n=1 Tax=Rhizobium tumorigenes TaxID=2041385 RepID=A0AAF1KIR9_9HYPH|nr:LuxR family transcriptional regulator [Rhizobium tumorigenes]WFR95940.1 LuxR family transcriptional regulator [Rhizobium tumorigenes]WFS01400.1 LuxR family transcriptional regulator [Rhizobium tumorigenes]
MALMDQAVLASHDFVSEIAGLKTQFDVFRFLKRVADAYRCRTFMVLNLPPTTSFALQSNTVVTNWPPELLTLYDQERLLVNSTVMRHLRNSTLPFCFDSSSPDMEREDGKTKTIVGLLVRFRIPRGAYFPTHDASGLRGAVSFSGDREAFTLHEMRDLSYIAIHVFEQLGTIRNIDTRLTDPLTDREIGCLTWTAAGKTSAEIAEILGLSEHTVNHYLNRTTKKLDTVNRTQAVAKALRIGIIK